MYNMMKTTNIEKDFIDEKALSTKGIRSTTSCESAFLNVKSKKVNSKYSHIIGFENLSSEKKKNIYKKQWVINNHEKRIQVNRNYRKNNPDTQRAYYKKNKGKLDEFKNKWNKENKDKLRQYFSNWCKKYPEKLEAKKLRAKAKVLGVSISHQQYVDMRKKQQNKCAICIKNETSWHKSGSKCDLSIDHCHKTLKVRGLLCKKCNSAIGFFCEDIELLKKAIIYLEKHNI